LLLCLPWLAGSLASSAHNMYLPALIFSFLFFLTGLRQVHNAFHYTLGLSKRVTEWVMFLLSILMLGSMHAVKINHLRHHKHLMDGEDIEAMSAQMRWWKALLVGPIFPWRTASQSADSSETAADVQHVFPS